MKIKFLYLVVFFQIIFCSSLAFSKTLTDFFSVEKLPVSATSVSSSEAKKKALTYARKRAFDIVLARLIKSEDLNDIYMPADYDIEKFVRGVKLNNEKTTSTTYSADIDVRINKDLIHEFLEDQDVKYLKDFPPATLLIFKNGTLFDFENQEYGDENVVSFTFLREKITENKFNSIMNSSLKDLSKTISKYNVNNIIVIDDTYLNEQESNKDEFTVSFKDKLFGMENTFVTTTSDFFDELVRNINDSYKLATSDVELSNKVSLIVPLFNLSDWISMEKKLASISDIKSYNVVALKFDKAQIEIEYNYDIDSVVNALKKIGINVEKKIDPTNNNYYLMIER